jgi:hypothetical protein
MTYDWGPEIDEDDLRDGESTYEFKLTPWEIVCIFLVVTIMILAVMMFLTFTGIV